MLSCVKQAELCQEKVLVKAPLVTEQNCWAGRIGKQFKGVCLHIKKHHSLVVTAWNLIDCH